MPENGNTNTTLPFSGGRVELNLALAPEDMEHEDRRGLEHSGAALDAASWRPLSALDPAWPVAAYNGLPRWPQRLSTPAEEE
mmetsp:Transcript_11368/g.27510  ORF Transcript_11368/g.27510 Transcript_11368/m.27510 type:complete len:82 (-) Transcript_11368:1377-1622(-)